MLAGLNKKNFRAIQKQSRCFHLMRLKCDNWRPILSYPDKMGFLHLEQVAGFPYYILVSSAAMEFMGYLAGFIPPFLVVVAMVFVLSNSISSQAVLLDFLLFFEILFFFCRDERGYSKKGVFTSSFRFFKS